MKERSEYYEQMNHSIPGLCYDKIGTNPSPILEAPFLKWLIKKDEIDRNREEGKRTT